MTTFPVGTFVRRKRHGPVGPHDVYEVLTNAYQDNYGSRSGPILMGRRTSRTVYPDRVDVLEAGSMVAVSAGELVDVLSEKQRFTALSVADLVDRLTAP